MTPEDKARIKQLFEQSNDAILIFDLDRGTVVDANKNAEILFERSRQNILGTHFEHHIHPAEFEDAEIKWNAALNGSDELYERIIVTRDGTSLVVEVRNQLVHTADNQPAYLQSSFSRRSKKRNIEQELQKSESTSKEFQEKLQALHEITFEFYKCETINELSYQVVKLGIERLGFERLGLLFFDDDYKYLLGVYGSDELGGIRHEHKKSWKLHQDSRELQLINATVRAKYWGDTILWGSGKAVGRGWDVLSILWDGKKGIGLLSTDNFHTGKPAQPYIVDLMALYGNLVGHLISQKRKEIEAQRYLERLRILQNIDRRIMGGEEPKAIAEEIIYILQENIDCDFISIKQYHAKEKMFSLLADTSAALDSPDDKLLTDDEIPLMLLNLSENADIEPEQIDAHTKIIDAWLQTNVHPNTFIPMIDDQKLIGVINIGLAEPKQLNAEQTEIAHQVANRLAVGIRQSLLSKEIQRHTTNLEELVEQRTSQLESKAEELEAFTYSVSHDLRSPLRAIDGFSRTLVNNFSEQLPEKAQHYLGRVQRNAIRMGLMIDDLLDLSRVGRKEIQFLRVDLNELIRDILAELKSNNQRGAADISVADLPHCYGDKNLLRLAIFNLISNAIKYSKKEIEPKIEIDFFMSEDDTPVYTIKDNGVGFDMKYVSKLFGVFQRLHTNREYEGNGIGLVTVHRIIEKHGGKVWAEAEVNHGSTFFFSFRKRLF